MKYAWGALAVVLLFGAGWMTHRTVARAEAAMLHAQLELSITRERVELQHWRDSMMVAASIDSARSDSLAARARTAERANTALRTTTHEAEAALDSAESAFDSLRHYPALVTALRSERDAALSVGATWKASLQSQLQVSADLRSRIAMDSLSREREDSIRRAHEIPAIDGPRTRSLGEKLLGAGETTAMVFASYGACKESLGSIGCLLGTAATVRRLIPH